MCASFFDCTITDWLSAIGTCGAVIVSLFYDSIKFWKNKPKITLQSETKERNTADSNAYKPIDIIFKFNNEGTHSSENFDVTIGKYWRYRDDEKRIPITINRVHLFDKPQVVISGMDLEVVAFHLQSSEYSDFMQNNSCKSATPTFYIGNYTEKIEESGKYYIEIKCCQSKLKPVYYYLELYLKLENFKNDESHFEIKLLQESDFKHINK